MLTICAFTVRVSKFEVLARVLFDAVSHSLWVMCSRYTNGFRLCFSEPLKPFSVMLSLLLLVVCLHVTSYLHLPLTTTAIGAGSPCTDTTIFAYGSQ